MTDAQLTDVLAWAETALPPNSRNGRLSAMRQAILASGKATAKRLIDDPRGFTAEWTAASPERGATTIAVYVSRARGVCRDYLAAHNDPSWTPQNSRRRLSHRNTAPIEPAPATLTEELNEFFCHLGRWPKLRAYLMPALVAAQADAGGAP